MQIEGTVSNSGTKSTFKSTNPLDASVVYTAAISVGAKSSKGVALESKTEWDFTTGGSTPTSVELSGDENDVWIFQIAEDLTVSSDVNLILSGGAQAKNIFWQVAGEVTIGTDSHFEGIILSMTGITLTTGAAMIGRLLAQTAVILDANVITEVN